MSQRTLLGISLISLSILAVLATTALAEPGNRAGKPLVVRPLSLAWTTEKWTGDDRPYQAIRADIDSLAAAHKITAALLEQYKQKAAPQYANPQAVFRWAYAGYQMQKAHPLIYTPYSVGGDYFYLVPSPHTYNYARLRFLSSAADPGGPELAALGKRLLQRDPNDRDVRYCLVRCYRPGLSEKEKQEALTMAQDYMRRYPGTPAAYSTLADVYFSAWLVKRNPADGQKAVAAFQEYLRLGPPTAEWRAQIQNTIRVIQENPLR